MPMIDAYRDELEQEAKATRRLLERVPEDRLGWRPHEKSMTLGRLAGHIAEIPEWGHEILDLDGLDFAEMDYTPFAPSSRQEILDRFDAALETFRQATDGVDDERLAQPWVMRMGDQVLGDDPRDASVRTWIHSHMVHHRGQLSVYLRLLDVPVPAIYGNSADENPYG